MWKSLVICIALLVGAVPVVLAVTPVQVEVVAVKRAPIPVFVRYPGTVVPSEYIQVAARMSGYVRNIKVDVGQPVHKGELLLTVDAAAVSASVQQARSQVEKAQAAMHTAKDNYERFKSLYAQQAIPKQRFQQVELAYTAAKSDYQAALAGLRSARNQIGYAEVRAPFDGVIFSKKVSNGQLVGPGHELMVLYNPKQLQINVEVGDVAYYRLKLGEQVPVEYFGPEQSVRAVKATVLNLVAASNPVTHTHTVKLLLPADTVAQGGEYARVLIPVKKRPAILIPATAIQIRAGITGVFVVNKDSEAEFRMVTRGERRGDQVVVLSGLFPGERLIVSAQGDLSNGVKVAHGAAGAA